MTIAILLWVPIQTCACACCANEGEYIKDVNKIADYELEVMKQIRIGNRALLYLTEADLEEDAFGITNPKEQYVVSGSLVSNAWRLTFRDGSKSGVLSLPLPQTMESFKADIHDGKRSGGGGPLLYKEWRLEGQVEGTGLFKSGIVGPTRYVLVLQGRGNGCDNPGDYKSWRLEVTGEKARFAFYGQLGIPRKAVL
jgi:nitrogen fixation protein